MARLDEIVDRVRSKNAGPFWLTIDIFCGDQQRYERVVAGLDKQLIGALYRCDPATILRFDMEDLSVVKFSLPRPVVQGSRQDSDMHASQWAWLLGEQEI
jgi:hypothetical protein